MKPSTVILYIMVTLSLLFSLTALIIVSGNSNFFASNSQSDMSTPTQSATNTKPTTTTQTPTPNPTLTPTTSDSELTYSANVTNEEELDIGEFGRTRVTYSIKLVYQGKEEITVNYSQFYLQLSIPGRWMEFPRQMAGTVPPENSGTVTLGPSDTTTVIQLVFEYPNAIYEDPHAYTVYYSLCFNGEAKALQG